MRVSRRETSKIRSSDQKTGFRFCFLTARCDRNVDKEIVIFPSTRKDVKQDPPTVLLLVIFLSWAYFELAACTVSLFSKPIQHKVRKNKRQYQVSKCFEA